MGWILIIITRMCVGGVCVFIRFIGLDYWIIIILFIPLSIYLSIYTLFIWMVYYYGLYQWDWIGLDEILDKLRFLIRFIRIMDY